MMVSPQHRMLIEVARAEMLFGEPEVLVAATHLTTLPGIEQVPTYGTMYIHLLFDRHEIISADAPRPPSKQVPRLWRSTSAPISVSRRPGAKMPSRSMTQ